MIIPYLVNEYNSPDFVYWRREKHNRHKISIADCSNGGSPLTRATVAIVYFGITFICFIPRIPPVFATKLQYQHRFFIYIKISREGHKIFKKTCKLKTWVGFVGQILCWTNFIRGFLQLTPWYPHWSNLCKRVGDCSVTTEACTSLSRVCAVWKSGSSLELSALCSPTVMGWSHPHLMIIQN